MSEPAAAADGTREGLPTLDGRVVVLTGASSGIGAQFARALDAAGARVVLAARRLDRLEALATAMRDAHLVRCDVAEEADRARLLEEAVGRFGRIDGLVNNAGVSNVVPALRETTDDFRRVLEVNLVAPFALARDAARLMRETGGGSIVNVASVVAVQVSSTTPQASYTASKAGLAGLTRELATQWARYAIRVNTLAPGPFTTEMTGTAFEEGDVAAYMRARIPLRRPGREGELDALLLTLLHPGTSYVTGQYLAVDGGLTIS
jgi:NAD(P)-dependent dehydrogenase (short-subunit alcohol dehydrogenase family)